MLIHREGLELATNTLTEEGATRFALGSIQVGTDGVVLASDGKACLRMAARVDEPTLFDDLAEEDTDDLCDPVLIPADVATAFLASMKKCKAKPGEAKSHVVVATRNGQVTLRSSDGKATRTFLLESPSSDLRFPDVMRLLRQHRPGTRVVLSVDVMSQILRTLRAVKAMSFSFDIPADYDGANAIAVAAFCDAGPIEGLIMPMRDDGEAHEFGAPAKGSDEAGATAAARRLQDAGASVKVAGEWKPVTVANVADALTETRKARKAKS